MSSSGRQRLPAYDKPWLSIENQLNQLESRGMIVRDRKFAEEFLWHLSYYRFSGYCLAFENNRHEFRVGTTFEQIKAAYDFDAVLRDLVNDALEVIEVDTRSAIAYLFGQKKGPFGHIDRANFRSSFDHENWMEHVRNECSRSSERFVTHFKENYSGFPVLPCWIAIEVMSFGTVSKLYSGLRDEFQGPIASRYNMQKGDFASVLHHLSYVRNACAHHCRLWDRVWTIQPKIPVGKNWQPPLIPYSNRLFVTLLFIYRTLKKCSVNEKFALEWRRRVNDLMKSSPDTPDALIRMGMPSGWYRHPYWV